MPINPGLLVGMNNGFVFHFWIILEVVNEYFLGISIHKAKNFIHFSLNINFLAFQLPRRLVKIPAPITIGSNQYFPRALRTAEFANISLVKKQRMKLSVNICVVSCGRR